MSRGIPSVLVEDLQAELDDFPDDRGTILLETAHYWHHVGETDSAIELLVELVGLSGEDGALARVALAELLFDRGRVDDAWGQLDTLRRDRVASPIPYHNGAELLEDRGEFEHALTWFNIALSHLTQQELADRETEMGAFSYANGVVAGRRRVRHALGMPDDELDESVESLSLRAAELLRAVTPDPRPKRARVLFWPREEIPRANEIWPDLVATVDDDSGFRQREASNRELAQSGVSGITMVPLTVAKLSDYVARTGADPMDSDVRLACIDEIISEGMAIAWPPPRNAPCWCGSIVKYKKCCGRPSDH